MRNFQTIEQNYICIKTYTVIYLIFLGFKYQLEMTNITKRCTQMDTNLFHVTSLDLQMHWCYVKEKQTRLLIKLRIILTIVHVCMFSGSLMTGSCIHTHARMHVNTHLFFTSLLIHYHRVSKLRHSWCRIIVVSATELPPEATKGGRTSFITLIVCKFLSAFHFLFHQFL